MNRSFTMSFAIAALGLAGCQSGDIVLSPGAGANINTGGGGGTAPDNPCAFYVESGQNFRGTVDANGNCFYSAQFVSDTRPITVSQITFPNFGGLHIFEDSLFIGEDVNKTAAEAGKRIPQEGEGTKLVIAPGNTMVFTQPDSYVRIARGSQIFAEGTENAPIVFTAEEDAILGTATESNRGLWGGIQINGNGRTNKCHDGTATGVARDAGVRSEFLPPLDYVNVHACNIEAEGRPATYGGNNNAENSGVLTYVIVKHAGYEVVLDSELNAFTFNAVGSGTTVHHVEAYTSQDDGFEMFGGAVSLHHVVGVNVGDDTLDFSEGWQGDIQYAVIVDTSGANNCIEADNTGGGLPDDTTPFTRGRLSNITCVTSNVDRNTGTNPSGKGDSEGWLWREGVFYEIYNSIVTSNESTMTSNECFEVDDTEGPDTVNAMQANDDPAADKGSDPLASYASSNVIACSEALKLNAFSPDNDGFNLAVWLAGGDGTAAIPLNNNTNNVVLTGADIPAVSLLDGGVGTRAYRTLELIQDSIGAEVFVQPDDLFDVSTLPERLPAFFSAPDYLGGASVNDDWLAGWTVGLDTALVP